MNEFSQTLPTTTQSGEYIILHVAYIGYSLNSVSRLHSYWSKATMFTFDMSPRRSPETSRYSRPLVPIKFPNSSNLPPKYHIYVHQRLILWLSLGISWSHKAHKQYKSKLLHMQILAIFMSYLHVYICNEGVDRGSKWSRLSLNWKHVYEYGRSSFISCLF